ncbi:MAG: hypothetical protein J7539_07755 [Niabella sp.]|nr:hypothetical protein [Niabella sp.]
MKLFFFILLFPYVMKAQSIKAISEKSIDSAITDIGSLMEKEISNKVKVIGVGDISVFAKESVKFNTALIGYLIKKKNFRNVTLMIDDWILRPLNSYLTGEMPLNNRKIDSLMKISVGNSPHYTEEFKSFVIWLKKYNLSHKNNSAKFSGIGLEAMIPNAYFLSEYIFPLDKKSGIQLAKTWGANNYPDSIAFNDIEAWYNEKIKAATQHSNILASCYQDIEHNKKLIEGVSYGTGKGAQEYFNYSFNLIAEAIANMKGKGENVVFYTFNKYIAKSDILPNGLTALPGPGKLLYNRLKNEYYACLTDFSDSATIYTFNRKYNKIEISTIMGSEPVKELFTNKDYFFNEHDKILEHYIPAAIELYNDQVITILPDTEISPMNALFLFRNLSTATILHSR